MQSSRHEFRLSGRPGMSSRHAKAGMAPGRPEPRSVKGATAACCQPRLSDHLIFFEGSQKPRLFYMSTLDL